MAFKMRSSKFRHVFGSPAKKEQCYECVKITKNAHDSNYCAANPKFVAIVTEAAGGGSFLVLPLERVGRVDMNTPKVCGHSGPVLDLKWNPFNDYVIASCSDDCTIKVWQIPEHGLKGNLTEWLVDLHGHQRRVSFIEWHPTAENILLSAGYDCQCILWNTETAEPINIINVHSDTIFSISWNRDGSLFASTAKDKKLRVIDPRDGTVKAETQGHLGSKSSKVVFIDKSRIFTTGFSKMSERQYALWDITNFTKPLKMETFDSSSGVLFPFYDPDTKVVYVAGKGDGNIRYYEIVDAPPFIHYLNQYQSSSPQRGLGFMPKRGVNALKCEIFRFYKLHAMKGICEPLSMIVPRKSEMFQEDIFPATASGCPSLTADEWISGQNREPILISLKDGLNMTNPKITTAKAVQRKGFTKLTSSQIAMDPKQPRQQKSNLSRSKTPPSVKKVKSSQKLGDTGSQKTVAQLKNMLLTDTQAKSQKTLRTIIKSNSFNKKNVTDSAKRSTVISGDKKVREWWKKLAQNKNPNQSQEDIKYKKKDKKTKDGALSHAPTITTYKAVKRSSATVNNNSNVNLTRQASNQSIHSTGSAGSGGDKVPSSVRNIHKLSSVDADSNQNNIDSIEHVHDKVSAYERRSPSPRSSGHATRVDKKVWGPSYVSVTNEVPSVNGTPSTDPELSEDQGFVPVTPVQQDMVESKQPIYTDTPSNPQAEIVHDFADEETRPFKRRGSRDSKSKRRLRSSKLNHPSDNDMSDVFGTPQSTSKSSKRLQSSSSVEVNNNDSSLHWQENPIYGNESVPKSNTTYAVRRKSSSESYDRQTNYLNAGSSDDEPVRPRRSYSSRHLRPPKSRIDARPRSKDTSDLSGNTNNSSEIISRHRPKSYGASQLNSQTNGAESPDPSIQLDNISMDTPDDTVIKPSKLRESLRRSRRATAMTPPCTPTVERRVPKPTRSTSLTRPMTFHSGMSPMVQPKFENNKTKTTSTSSNVQYVFTTTSVKVSSETKPDITYVYDTRGQSPSPTRMLAQKSEKSRSSRKVSSRSSGKESHSKRSNESSSRKRDTSPIRYVYKLDDNHDSKESKVTERKSQKSNHSTSEGFVRGSSSRGSASRAPVSPSPRNSSRFKSSATLFFHNDEAPMPPRLSVSSLSSSDGHGQPLKITSASKEEDKIFMDPFEDLTNYAKVQAGPVRSEPSYTTGFAQDPQANSSYIDNLPSDSPEDTLIKPSKLRASFNKRKQMVAKQQQQQQLSAEDDSSHDNKVHVKKIWSSQSPTNPDVPTDNGVPETDLELRKAYFRQVEEIKNLKQEIQLKDKRIRGLEEELRSLREDSPSSTDDESDED